MYIVAIGWLYVALMMSAAEGTNSNGTVLGAIVTFLLYGVGPVALVVYLMAWPGRRKAAKARDDARWQAHQAARSAQPDAGGKTPADPVAPMRKEP